MRGCNGIGCGPWSSVTTVTVARPPTTPTLTVPAYGLSGNYTVSWSSVSGATSYSLEEKFNTGSWSTSYSGGNLNKAYSSRPVGSYSYRVKACNAGGCSPESTVGVISVVYAPTGKPTVTAPAQSTAGSYTVSWTSVTNATSYQLEENFNGGAWGVVSGVTGTSKAFTGKPAGTYGYRVKACNVAGCGPVSTAVSVVEIDPPATAPAINAPSSSTSGNYVLYWTAIAGATSYSVEEHVDGGAWNVVSEPTVPSVSITGRPEGIYSYRAKACNAAGCGPVSSTVTVIVSDIPIDAPTISAPAAVARGQMFNIALGHVEGGEYWDVQMRLSDSSIVDMWDLIYSDSAFMFPYYLEADAEILLRARACNQEGCGPYSPPITVVVGEPCYICSSMSKGDGNGEGE